MNRPLSARNALIVALVKASEVDALKLVVRQCDQPLITPGLAAEILTVFLQHDEDAAFQIFQSVEERRALEPENLVVRSRLQFLIQAVCRHCFEHGERNLQLLSKWNISEKLKENMEWTNMTLVGFSVELALVERGIDKARALLNQAVRRNPTLPVTFILGPILLALLRSPSNVASAVQVLRFFPELSGTAAFPFLARIFGRAKAPEVTAFLDRCEQEIADDSWKPVISNGRLMISSRSHLGNAIEHFNQLKGQNHVDANVRFGRNVPRNTRPDSSLDLWNYHKKVPSGGGIRKGASIFPRVVTNSRATF